jgi:hypothetical protein
MDAQYGNKITDGRLKEMTKSQVLNKITLLLIIASLPESMIKEMGFI